jgi:hypothetical protein
VRRVDVDAGQLRAAFERAQVLDLRLDAADAEQLLRRGVGDLQVGDADAAAHLQRQRRPLREREHEVGAQQARLQRTGSVFGR